MSKRLKDEDSINFTSELSFSIVPFVASMTPFVKKTKHPTRQGHVIMELQPKIDD